MVRTGVPIPSRASENDSWAEVASSWHYQIEAAFRRNQRLRIVIGSDRGRTRRDAVSPRLLRKAPRARTAA